ncbi:hypothetical protein Kpol_269p8 [Vanderwaltozyma polyspora DSM 70294]|uniref:Protein IVY1 n=1 Tax=Vanderwaltozyma polyspora (strain ATCC 22028 / DSM 70294 / BCRC 21397 / CBS 2163 / NBRC 10782 / NRRL Y-8283 / UCD 57-17) TaxID=436907 RepID=A7TT38_VANPO|nr:uncharacterized protein Kpol_269p8 [Vanderwaltozyma polyspora DSM 70294]EDO14574.1 hypothetical protein Kpol_269p8 [Vanderwaltozyma polyspora DSM 70294]
MTTKLQEEVENSVVNESSSNGRYAPHLSEFYSIVNKDNARADVNSGLDTRPSSNNTNGNGNGNYNNNVNHEMENESLDREVNVSSSSTDYSHRRTLSIKSGMSTISDLRTLVTKRDTDNTAMTIKELLKSSVQYSKSLSEVSERSSNFAHSLENLARLKGCNDDIAERMLSASGLFHLLANHQQIMSEIFSKLLAEDISKELDSFNFNSNCINNEFKAKCKEQALKLKLQEKHNIELSKRKVRNILSYRESLSNLQVQLDHLETLKHDFYQDSYLLVESTCEHILNKVASTVRAQVEISENIARKGWSGGGLDDLLMKADDPFHVEPDEFPAEVMTTHSNLVSPIVTNDTTSTNTTDYNQNRGEIITNKTDNKDNNNKSISLHSKNDNDNDDDDINNNNKISRNSTTESEDENEDENNSESDTNFDNSFSLPQTVTSNRRKSQLTESDEDNDNIIIDNMLSDMNLDETLRTKK